MVELMIRDPHRYCPDCGLAGHIDFTEIPASVRTYTRAEGEYSDHLGPSRDCECRDCGASLTLTGWEVSHG